MPQTSWNLWKARDRILRSPCRMALNGDSISSDGLTSRMFNGLYKNLTPSLMTGVANSATMLGGGVGGVASYTDGGGAYSGDAVRGFGAALGGIGGVPSCTAGSAAAEGAIWPLQFADSHTNTAARAAQGAIASFTQTFDGAFPVANRSGCAGGDWMTGTTTLKMFLYSGVDGLPFTSGFGHNIDRPIGNSINFLNPDNTNGINESGYWTFTKTAGSGASAVGWAMQAASVDESAKNIYLLGTRYTVSELGLELQACATGSSAISNHIDTSTRCTQAARNQYVKMHNTNTVLLWFGENEPSLANAAEIAAWKADLITLIASWRTAIVANGANPLFLLITQYETVSSTTPARVSTMAQVHLEIAQAYEDVCFYGLGLVAGTYAAINGAGYLADGVHPSDTGATYFAGLINSALIAAPGPLGAEFGFMGMTRIANPPRPQFSVRMPTWVRR